MLRLKSTLSMLLALSASLAPAQNGSLNVDYDRAAIQGVRLAQSAIQESESYRKRSDIAFRCGQVLVADGDSWFDYPLRADIVSELERSQWAVFSAARHGDKLESMMYDEGQLSSLYRTLARTFFYDSVFSGDRFNYETCDYDMPRNYLPKAILLSAGWNDIVGDELAFLFEHGESSDTQQINTHVVDGLFCRLNRILIEYVSAIRHMCQMIYRQYDTDREASCESIGCKSQTDESGGTTISQRSAACLPTSGHSPGGAPPNRVSVTICHARPRSWPLARLPPKSAPKPRS